MSREAVWGCPAASVVLEVLEVAVREALSAMDTSRSVGMGVGEGEGGCGSSGRSNSVKRAGS
jgi:hypothetical protein